MVYPCSDCTMALCDRSVEAPLLDWATIDWFGEQCFFGENTPPVLIPPIRASLPIARRTIHGCRQRWC